MALLAMMAAATQAQGMQNPGQDQGTNPTNPTNRKEMFLMMFAGEVLTSFKRTSVTEGRFVERTIKSGKSAQFPVVGRSRAVYLKPGESLDSKRKQIKHSQKVIEIDDLLTDDVLIFDLDDAMNHFDVRGIYSTSLGESLAVAKDAAILAEAAKLCNSDENIKGLGKPSILELTTDSADPVERGKAIIAQLTKARAALAKNYVPSLDRTYFTNPDDYSAILAALMPNAANYAALINPEDGSIRNVMTFSVVETPHLIQGGAGYMNPEDDTASPEEQQHAFPTEGKVTNKNVVGIFGHKSAVGTVKLRELGLEPARRPELQADQIIAKYAMGHGGLRPEAIGAIVEKTGG